LLAGGLAAWRAADSRAARAAGAERAGGDLDPRRVAVLYFEDESEKRELAPLADGLTEALIGALAQVPSLYVVSRNGVAPFRGDSALDSAAHALKVGSLVVGRVRRTPRGVHVDVRLLDVASNTDVGAQGFDVGASAVGSLGDSVTARVSEFLRKQLGTRIELAERRNATASTQAWLALQRGERLRKDADAALAAGDLEAAVSALTAADATLASAESLDAAWAEAPALRAFVAAQRGRALRARPADAKVAVDSGIAHADRALGLDPRNADALEARGTLRYLRSQQLVSTDPAGSDLALVQAEGDLVASTGANPGQASAWATLSVLYYRKQSVQQANLAAQNAYRADAYLRSADAILTRLFWTSHDMESFQDAQRWCAEGTRRFPAQPFFTECQLWLLTTKLAAPDPPRAWALYRELKRVTPPARWPTDSLRGQIIVAMVLSREPALVDSARRVLDRTNASAELDPQREITGLRAVGRVFLHDYDAAVTDIETYLTSNPEHARGFKTNTAWWWRDPGLQNHPRFQRLLAGIR
jgi:TolB-like protein